MTYEKWLEETEGAVRDLLKSPFEWQEAVQLIALLVHGAEKAFNGGSLKKQNVELALEHFHVVARVNKAVNIPFVPEAWEAKIYRWAINLLIEQAVASLKFKR